jgi:hypothetical protein
MPDGRLWLARDSYAAQTAWSPRHVGKELRLSRLGAFDAALGVIRADAEADAARKTGDHDRAARHEQLAASYRLLRDHYQQQEQGFAQTMTDRQEWEQATAGSRRLAIAADTELRRRHPQRKIEPLCAIEPTPVSDAERPDLTPQKGGSETARMGDLTVQPQAFRPALNEQAQRVPGEDATWANLSKAFPASQALWRNAILQPPKPQITPSAQILQLADEHDTEPEAAD